MIYIDLLGDIMQERSEVLIKNEKQANVAVAKVMRITFLIFTLVFILNVVGIFVVKMNIMTTAFLLGSVFLWLPTLLVNVLKKEGEGIKYFLVICAVVFVTVITTTLSYHAVLLYIYAIAIASLYFDKKLNIITTILSVVGVSLGQILCFTLHTISDDNVPVMYKLVVFGIVPRALVLIALAAIFTMLCERTAGMLGNLMGAEEQERMLNDMKLMQEKSKQTSDELLNMVKELSVITESSMQANESIALEAGNILQSFSENTDSMDDINVKTQDINNKLIELAKMNSELARLSVKVSDTTKVNQSKMDDATNRMQQINESTNECRDIIWELGEKSKEIFGITQVITGISNQTNILALNASIEAARAGEHGKGFAVVASEIQKLAEQTRRAVDDIGNIVTEAVEHTEKAVSVMDQSVELTSAGMESIREVGDSTAEITSSNITMTERLNEMDKTVEAIRESSNRVAQGMEMVNDATKSNCGAIEHVSAATEENSAGVEEIESMVLRIRSLAASQVETESGVIDSQNEINAMVE